MSEPQPFAGITVVEFGQFVAVPYTAQLLADGGAHVIKVEPLEGEPTRSNSRAIDGFSRMFLGRNRGKHSLPLNLRHPEAARVIEALVSRADVVLTNMRPGLAAELGLDYEALATRHPRLIVGNVTAFGEKGPDAGLAGMDLVVQARSGLMAMNGGMRDGRPVAEGSPISDYMAAALLAFGVSSALLRRERTGSGGKVDVALLMAALVMQNNLIARLDRFDAEPHAEYARWLAEARASGVPYAEQAARTLTPRLPGMTAVYYRTYSTEDSAIAVACASQRLRRQLLVAAGLEDPGLDGAVPENELQAHYDALCERMEAIFAAKTTAEWETILREHGIPASGVRFPFELIDDEQAEANEMVISRDHPSAGPFRVLGRALTLDGDGFVPAAMPLPFGSETAAILEAAGFTPEEIDALVESGAVGRRDGP